MQELRFDQELEQRQARLFVESPQSLRLLAGEP
jgi:hypothetical protein